MSTLADRRGLSFGELPVGRHPLALDHEGGCGHLVDLEDR